ncbi:unnamed protein product [Heligmosomoides polygyrus]|uniref:Guanylate cyclase domain-containing protein n=1 Tax=Heligmosomoides polygyrus TaxID=6339 RepID=A0A3P7ZP67_HELPZ|nr:unnamed protein product [Heligmosomoides polygyrus]
MIQMRAIFDRAGFRIIRNRINPAGYPKMHDSDPMSTVLPGEGACFAVRGHHGENYFIYVSTGIIHSWERGEAVLMLFWFVMSSSVIILMNSFVYRYVHICRPDLSYLYSSRRWILLIWVLNVLLLSNCAFLLVMTSIPKEIFRRQVYGDLTSLDGNAFIGISLEHRANELSGFLVADSAMIMLLLSITGIFCATVCPTLFLYFPSCVIYAILFGNLRHGPLVTDFLGILTSLYSLFNPLVTMFSISDYRRYVLSLLRCRKVGHLRRECENARATGRSPVEPEGLTTSIKQWACTAIGIQPSESDLVGKQTLVSILPLRFLEEVLDSGFDLNQEVEEIKLKGGKRTIAVFVMDGTDETVVHGTNALRLLQLSFDAAASATDQDGSGHGRIEKTTLQARQDAKRFQ